MGSVTVECKEIFNDMVKQNNKNAIGYIFDLKTYDCESSKDRTILKKRQDDIPTFISNKIGSTLWSECEEIYIYPIKFKNEKVTNENSYQWTNIRRKWKNKYEN